MSDQTCPSHVPAAHLSTAASFKLDASRVALTDAETTQKPVQERNARSIHAL